MSDKVKVAVIGGGPGGYIAAIRAAQLGAEVCVIEENKLGGTCLNIGCIPTKSIIHSAEILEELKERGTRFGIEAKEVTVNFEQVMKNKDKIASQLVMGVNGLMRANGIEVIKGHASFISKTEMKVIKDDGIEETIKADRIILATGSQNVVPPIPGVKDNPLCIDSTGALNLKELPESMVVIGAGVIGLEIASAYAAFGTKITVIEAMDHALPMLDREVTAVGLKHLKKMGVEILMSSKVKEVKNVNEKAVVICENPKGEEKQFTAEKVLVAVGRKANIKSLNIEITDIDICQGKISVDDRMRTNVENIYAIGDCTAGHAQLAHTASMMGEVAAENCMGIEKHYDESTNPTCVYIEPEAAAVGLRENQLETGTYKVGKFPMMANGKALIMNDGEGLVKVIADANTEKILGIHMIGPRATDLISEGAVAIKMGMTIDQLIDTIHSHPTISESVREAALDVQGRTLNMPSKRK